MVTVPHKMVGLDRENVGLERECWIIERMLDYRENVGL